MIEQKLSIKLEFRLVMKERMKAVEASQAVFTAPH